MAFPKGPGKEYRLVADYPPINGQCELVPGPMRHPEIEGEKGVGAVAFCTMDCLQGYWQYPLAEEAREYFTFVTRGWPVHADARAAGSHECYVVLLGDDDGGLGKSSGACLFDLCG